MARGSRAASLAYWRIDKAITSILDETAMVGIHGAG